ncbi:inactive N-acetylated-alpha-linked acidic dipeptidase-like protein 2 [Silurus asotus]|uniref:Inactive N-acetylated-alpha-linked acidic dipeptidase-like protein 2 n=1 Tax=Silurus asotus TaxID=30991 RepID=A0AAD5ADY2_SILAS|nr:inactive N-acetylated-alpha-linked acidic dipeptidase-like protein 2 [Silurus asotus]
MIGGKRTGKEWKDEESREGADMAYTKAYASHGISMQPQDLECDEQLTSVDLEWEMEPEMDEHGLDNFRLECADSQTMENLPSGEIITDQGINQPSVSPHGRFERLQEDPNYVLQYSGTVPKAHKISVTCIIKYLLIAAGAFILGLLIGLHGKQTEGQPAKPTGSTDMLDKVLQNITAENIQAQKSQAIFSLDMARITTSRSTSNITGCEENNKNNKRNFMAFKIFNKKCLKVKIKRNFDSLSRLSEEDRVKYLARRWEELGLKNVQLLNYTVLVSSPGSSPNTITELANKRCFLPSGASCDTQTQISMNESFVFAAYSSVGILEAELVDVQYGSFEDLRLIGAEVNVTNKIALLKIGEAPLLNTLSVLAEMGFGACLTYVDPCNLPKDQPFLQKAFGVTLNPGGDPSTPEYPSTDGSFREDRRNLTSLLVQPISANLAQELLSAPSNGHGQPCVPMKMASGSGQRIIRLNISSQTSYKTVYNVIGYLRGKINPDRYVLVGARHSSWYDGTMADWSGGAAVVSQIIASLTTQTHALWQPDRTIVFCSSGGSSLGNIGTFEWGEENKVVLEDRVVAYISLQNPVRAYGPQSTVSPSLRQLASDIYKTHIKHCPHAGSCTGMNISSLQSSVVMDFFTSQLAAPLVEFASSANTAETAPFLYEAFFPFESSLAETLDPTFRLHETVAKMTAEAILRLATDPVLPFSPLDIALDIQNKLKADPLIRPDLLAAAASLRESSGFFQSEIMRPANDPKERDPAHVRMLNDVLQDLEKSFLISDPPQGFSRNILYGLSTKTQGFAMLKASAEDSRHSSRNRSLSHVFNSICSAEKLIQSGLGLFENDPESSN